MNFFLDVLAMVGADVVSIHCGNNFNLKHPAHDESSVLVRETKKEIEALSVYTRDRAIIIGNTAYMPDVEAYSHYKHSIIEIDENGINKTIWRSARKALLERQNSFSASFAMNGIKTMVVPGVYFDGGDILYDVFSNTIICGVDDHQKFNIKKFEAFMKGQGFRFLSVQKTGKAHGKMAYFDKIYYHLDTALSILPCGEVIWIPEAFNQESQNKLKGLFDGRPRQTLTPASDIEAKGDYPSFVANIVFVGKTIILSDYPSYSDFGAFARENKNAFRNWFTELGYTPIFLADYMDGERPDAKEGSLHCLTNMAYPDARSSPSLS